MNVAPSRERLRVIWLEQLRPILVMVVCLLSFRSAVADWYDVPTGSMRPTILEGDRILVNKLAYDLRVPFAGWRVATWSDPAPGEIVILYSPRNGERLVKRLIAGPGDTVELRSNVLYINGRAQGYGAPDASVVAQVPVGERAGVNFGTEELAGHRHPIALTPGLPAIRSFGPVTVPAGSYVVMGDNRDNSADSRVFGFVDRGLIVGRAHRVALSLDPAHWYRLRWGRTLRSLE